jgi:hypothetical protein
MWLQTTTAIERRTLLAGYLGHGLDGFDLMVYSFITSAIGGWAAGVLADRAVET